MHFNLHNDLKRDGILIGRFPLCLVLLINDSNFPWFVLVPQRAEIRECFDLNAEDYQALWIESRAFSEGIMRSFTGDKLNVAALGNMTPQLHIHHIVRYSTDAAWPAPIWGKFPHHPYTEKEIDRIRAKIAAEKIAQFAAEG